MSRYQVFFMKTIINSRLTAGIEKGNLSPDQFFFLSYLISREALDLKVIQYTIKL